MMAAYGNASPAVAASAQRYLNKASGKMETKQKMSGYRRPAAKAPAKTPAKAPARAPAQPVAKSLLQMTPKEIEARAASIVNSEVTAERLPFQQRQAALTGEQAGVQTAHAANYAKLDTQQAALQAGQQAGAKTYQNAAADLVKKAGEAAPGAAESAERLGQPAPTPGSSIARQQEAARTLLSGIAAGAQAGSLQRQQAEEAALAQDRASGQREGAAGSTQIASDYGKQKATTANSEAQLLAGKAGRTGKYAQSLLGEQEKLKTAAAALGNQENKTAISAATAKNTIQRSGETQQLNKQKFAAEVKYKGISAEQGAKRLEISQAAAEAKRSTAGSNLVGPSGKPLTNAEVKALNGQAATVFNTFDQMKQNGTSNAVIRQSLVRGYRQITEHGEKYNTHTKKMEETTKTTKASIGTKVTNAPLLNAIEQLWVYHTINPQTRAAAEHGLGYTLPDDKTLFESLSGRKWTAPKNTPSGTSGSAKAPGKKK